MDHQLDDLQASLPIKLMENAVCLCCWSYTSTRQQRGHLEKIKGKMEGAPPPQAMTYYDHVQKRREDKGCLYAWFVYLLIKFPLPSLSSNACSINSFPYYRTQIILILNVLIQSVHALLLLLLLWGMRVLFREYLLLLRAPRYIFAHAKHVLEVYISLADWVHGYRSRFEFILLINNILKLCYCYKVSFPFIYAC